jgi:hypothetical protein
LPDDLAASILARLRADKSLSDVMRNLGGFSLAIGSKDAAVLTTLAPHDHRDATSA